MQVLPVNRWMQDYAEMPNMAVDHFDIWVLRFTVLFTDQRDMEIGMLRTCEQNHVSNVQLLQTSDQACLHRLPGPQL